MKKLVYEIERLKKSDIKNIIDKRISEFKNMGKKPSKDIFKELCFCLLTANFNAERSIKIHCALNDKFIILPENGLAKELKKCGHRFPSTRAKYIYEARKWKDDIKHILGVFSNGKDARDGL